MVFQKALFLLFFFAWLPAALCEPKLDCSRPVALATLLQELAVDEPSYAMFLLRLDRLRNTFNAQTHLYSDDEGAPSETGALAKVRSQKDPDFPLLLEVANDSENQTWVAESPRQYSRQRLDELHELFFSNSPTTWASSDRTLIEIPFEALSEQESPQTTLDVEVTSPTGTARMETTAGNIAGSLCAFPAGALTAGVGIVLTVGCAWVLPPILRQPISWFGAFATSFGGLLAAVETKKLLQRLLRSSVTVASVEDAAVPLLEYLLANGGKQIGEDVYYVSFGDSPRIDILLDGEAKKLWAYKWPGPNGP
ncbi:MAG: hypothetical protein H6617_12165 [Bdellovibrionaceae bacterium]|nr:hypothetical protein [Bdellovibrionales bacterium]MCB9255429.1 hypothetical protein [Pseudobdellovibrionaceae bacterium]